MLTVCLNVHDLLRGRRVLFFIDNNGVRQMLAKGSTPVPSLFVMTAMVHRAVAEAECLPWFCRVPSKSNPADAPSRGAGADWAGELNCAEGPALELERSIVDALVSQQSFHAYMKAECG